jgi:hypothetical protein
MKMSKSQIEKMVRRVFDELKSNNLITFKTPEDKTFKRAVELIEKEYEVESALDKEVHRMLDDLEKQNPSGFQRGKMFNMLKRKLAEQKGIIL